MSIRRRPNGSIIGNNVIPTSTFPSTVSGLWDKNEHCNLISVGYWSGLGGAIVTYTITSTSTTATFFNMTITGNAGAVGGYAGGAGGTYSITNNNGTGGGVNGGNGYGTGGFGGNGTSGGSIGGGYGNSRPYVSSNNISGLYEAVSLAGYNGDGTFGSGGGGGSNYGNDPYPGGFAGGGGGGVAYVGSQTPGSGGGGAVVIMYTAGYTDYCIVKTSSGSFTLPNGTLKIKVWAIGTGGTGATQPGGANSGAGGGGGGVAYGVIIG